MSFLEIWIVPGWWYICWTNKLALLAYYMHYMISLHAPLMRRNYESSFNWIERYHCCQRFIDYSHTKCVNTVLLSRESSDTSRSFLTAVFWVVALTSDQANMISNIYLLMCIFWPLKIILWLHVENNQINCPYEGDMYSDVICTILQWKLEMRRRYQNAEQHPRLISNQSGTL